MMAKHLLYPAQSLHRLDIPPISDTPKCLEINYWTNGPNLLLDQNDWGGACLYNAFCWISKIRNVGFKESPWGLVILSALSISFHIPGFIQKHHAMVTIWCLPSVWGWSFPMNLLFGKWIGQSQMRWPIHPITTTWQFVSLEHPQFCWINAMQRACFNASITCFSILDMWDSINGGTFKMDGFLVEKPTKMDARATWPWHSSTFLNKRPFGWLPCAFPRAAKA